MITNKVLGFVEFANPNFLFAIYKYSSTHSFMESKRAYMFSWSPSEGIMNQESQEITLCFKFDL